MTYSQGFKINVNKLNADENVLALVLILLTEGRMRLANSSAMPRGMLSISSVRTLLLVFCVDLWLTGLLPVRFPILTSMRRFLRFLR